MLFGESQLTAVHEKAKDYVLKWASIKGGIFPNGMVNEKRLQILREEKMSSMLMIDVQDEEKSWVDYEDEETQVKLDIADMILERFIDETSTLLNLIM